MNNKPALAEELMSLAVECFWNAKADTKALNHAADKEELLQTVRHEMIRVLSQHEGEPNFADDAVWADAKPQILARVIMQGAND